MVDYKKIINALDLDRVSLMGVENKKEYDIVTIKGGLNGGGDIFYYLTQIDKIVCELSADKREVWLIKWENDCADDVWYLKLCVKETKRISDIKKSISDFCKNQEDFVMKLLNVELAKQVFKARFKGDWYLEWDDLYTYETKTFEL